jgi:hypothetical protein
MTLWSPLFFFRESLLTVSTLSTVLFIAELLFELFSKTSTNVYSKELILSFIAELFFKLFSKTSTNVYSEELILSFIAELLFILFSKNSMNIYSEELILFFIVRYHCGGWPEEVNSCFLNSYMVYL